MKQISTLVCCWLWTVYAFGQQLTGIVTDENNNPLKGVSVSLKISRSSSITQDDGTFGIPSTRDADTLLIKYIGYISSEVPLVPGQTDAGKIVLSVELHLLEEVVVSTGYYQIPRERATGAFTHIDGELLNRSVSTNILDRLEGVTNALQFDRSNSSGEFIREPRLRIRGLSSIHADTEPLIVVDGFPFEGGISSINPNDVEDVTILRDAAAASIWGARAGNGVIVINTKKGGFDKAPQVSFISNFNLVEIPDLYYNPNYLPSSARMEVEEFMFNQGLYTRQNWTPVPGHVRLLFERQDGLLNATEFAHQKALLEKQDVRSDAAKHLYQHAFNRQYALSIQGGGSRHRYWMSGGLDRNQANIRHNANERFTLKVGNSVRISNRLDINAEVNYVRQFAVENGYNLQSLRPSAFETSPYTFLKNEDGSSAAINHSYLWSYVEGAEESGLLDWHFRPLEEVHLHDLTRQSTDFRLSTGLDYRFLKDWSASVKYQYQEVGNTKRDHYNTESYYVRDVINRFTQEDYSSPIPQGDILEVLNNGQQMHYGRVQVNYASRWLGETHDLNGLVGVEIRQHHRFTNPGYKLYGYNDDVLTGTANLNYNQRYPTRPRSSAFIPALPTGMLDITDRFLSYFTNVSYAYRLRYILSASVRWDASNIFGVKTNQRGVPLWSIGGSWKVDREAFYRWEAVPLLKLRLTYGINGNVNSEVSASPSMFYNSTPHFVTNQPHARLTSAGNPSLRWERVGILNLGIDFGLIGNRVSGSLEYYSKHSKDLIGQDFMDPTTGIIREAGFYTVDNRVNYASMVTNGVDMTFSTINLDGKFKWQSDILFNYSQNKVTDYMLSTTESAAFQVTTPLPRNGRSLDALYAWRYGGLDPADGALLTPNGDRNYATYYSNASPDDLLLMGVSVAPYHGSLRNTFSWGALSFSANIIWKAGFHFRRSSVNYGQLFRNGLDHRDFLNRWQKDGDEQLTIVPAMPTDINSQRDELYGYSEALVLRGDHIRLDDLQIAYALHNDRLGKWFSQLRFYAYSKNTGILWHSADTSIDPDRAHATYPASRSIAMGVQLSF